jgi:DNA-binding SARP family transcriptional activator
MAAEAQDDGVRIELLGRFQVAVGDDEVVADAWPGRRAAELVQLLALADGHRLTRDQVVEALWPHLEVAAGAANLRKAAHHARQALASPDAVVLRGGQVALFPSRSVETDAGHFEAQARVALAGGGAAACAVAASAYTGDLLPGALYEEWTQAARERLRSGYVELLRRSGQWERLVEAEPTDEPAYRELMRRELAAGSRPAAIRWYGRLRTALRCELGILPSGDTQALYDECVAGLGVAEPAFVGRQLELARVTALLRSEPGGALVVRGPAGIGKSALCREVARVVRADGWMVIAVGATEAGGPYEPLASVAEQLLARDRALLDAVGSRAAHEHLAWSIAPALRRKAGCWPS